MAFTIKNFVLCIENNLDKELMYEPLLTNGIILNKFDFYCTQIFALAFLTLVSYMPLLLCKHQSLDLF